MEQSNLDQLKSLIREVPDFPKKGILFYDVTTLIKDPKGLSLAVKKTADLYRDKGITKVVGIESRGFIIGAAVAHELGAGFVTARKPGKLPAQTISISYSKEYGEDTIEIHSDSITEDDVVLIYDDLLATGGTMKAVYGLVNSIKPRKIYINFTVELLDLKGRSIFPDDVQIDSLLVY